MDRPESTQERETQISRWRYYLGLLRARIWLVVASIVVSGSLAAIYIFRAPNIYQARAIILIEKREPKVVRFDEVSPLAAADRDYYETQYKLLRSKAVLERALQDARLKGLPELKIPEARSNWLGEIKKTIKALLGITPSGPPEPWELLQRRITVDPLRGTQLVSVKSEATNPESAAKMANAVAEAFEQFHLERKFQTGNEAFRYLERQKEMQEKRVIEAENALQKLREQTKQVSLGEDQKENPVLVRLSQLSDELTQVELKRIDVTAQYEVIKGALSRSGSASLSENEALFAVPAVRADPSIGELRRELLEREQELDELSGVYGAEHPRLQIAQAKLSSVKAKLEESLSSLVNSLALQCEALQKREEELRKKYDEQKSSALELSKQSLLFARLKYDAERQRKLFDAIVERLREVDVTSEYAKTNVEVVELATVPRLPARPKRLRFTMLWTFFGLILGVSLAFFVERLDDTLKTPEELQYRLGIPVLGFVPAIQTDGRADGFSCRGLASLVEPRSSASEAYRSIRTDILFSPASSAMRSILVTSATAREGKTTCASNLAIVMAQSGKRVLLADADFRKPRLHRVFGLENERGLSDILAGKVSLSGAVCTPHYDGEPVEGLEVLTAGNRASNPAELLSSPAVRRFLKEASDHYEVVILDSPPLLFVADAASLAGMCDGVIFVARARANRDVRRGDFRCEGAGEPD